MLQVQSLRLCSTQAHPTNRYGTLTVGDRSEPSRLYPVTITVQVMDPTAHKIVREDLLAGDDDFSHLYDNKNAEGQISYAESLRSVFLSVSRSLKRLGAAPQEALWKRKRYFIRLQDSLRMGIHSLSVMELTFRQLKAEMIEKAAAAAATRKLQTDTGAYRNAELCASTFALLQCDIILEACRLTISSLEVVNRKIGVQLSGAQGVDAEGRDLNMVIQDASAAMRVLGGCLRPAMQIINATEGASPIIRHTFKSCREMLMPIKSSADRWFRILGIGAFSFRNDLKTGWRTFVGAAHKN